MVTNQNDYLRSGAKWLHYAYASESDYKHIQRIIDYEQKRPKKTIVPKHTEFPKVVLQ